MSDESTEKQYAFTVALTVYSMLKQSSKGKSTAKKQEKSVKTKELLFPLNEDNYIEFLESILEKHGQTQFKVSKKHRFSFKFTMAKTKSQRITEAMDVNNKPDYKEMIFVDMKDVEKIPSHQVNARSGDEESSISDDNQLEHVLSNCQSPQSISNHLDDRLGRWRTMLTKKYKNEQNEGLTYVTPSGDALPLTPAMVLDWARAMEEGQATLKMPPNIPSFDLENKAPFLHPACKAQALSRSSALSQNPTMPDINSLTSVILLQTLANLSGQSSASQPKSPTRRPLKKVQVAYEKRYHGGGGSRFTGPPMVAADDDDAPKDYNLWYQSTDHDNWLPVPHGFIVCEDEEEDSLDSSFK
ncbi:hypothetical protein JVT61DRAFT_12157 [Boletus reticuloceps]|uniref:Uncharacterized protein n=1 Tax=Boletus reticuloceps TaxID=495285 RepID=A0A8I2YEF2_9AGAM|nr:hypothetical protein JVT61DRAFT_12157 [Boletus reticuloceps]